jgi:hypothetical protein
MISTTVERAKWWKLPANWQLVPLLMIYPIYFMGNTLALDTNLRLGHQPSDYNLVINMVQGWKRLPFPWSKSSFTTFPEIQPLWRLIDLSNLHFTTYSWIMTRWFEAEFIVTAASKSRKGPEQI